MEKEIKAGVWISTKDALPQDTNDILFHYTVFDWLLFGYFDVDNDSNTENDRTNNFYAANESGEFHIEDVDYWMKIPKIPGSNRI